MTAEELRQAIAVALCDCWFTITEQPTRWPTASAAQRRTFQDMADFAIAAGKRGERSVEQLAFALCLGFWLNAADRPGWARTWQTHWEAAREVFRICARRVLALAAELRLQRKVASPIPMTGGALPVQTYGDHHGQVEV